MRRRVAGGRRQPLARAGGPAQKERDGLSLLDATAGLGRDGYTLAALGARVTARRAQADGDGAVHGACRRALQAEPSHAQIAERLELIEADAATLLSGDRCWDADLSRSDVSGCGQAGAAFKEMQLLRELTGGDADADALLEPALAHARACVSSVKRPPKAAWLAGAEPSMRLRSSHLRFDVYLTTVC